MKLEFHDSYLIFIIALLWLLCFLRQIITFLRELSEIFANCLYEGCLCCENLELCGLYQQNLLLLFVFLHPVVFGAITIHNHITHKKNITSSVYNFEIETWQAIIINNTSHIDQDTDHFHLDSDFTIVTKSNVYIVDYLFWVLPFALCASFSSMLLVHLSKAGLLTEYTVWDSEIEEEVLLYEGAYAVELFCLNISMIAASSGVTTYTEILFAGMSLTLIELYFSATSRFPRTNLTEHNISMAFLLSIALVSGILWANIADYTSTLNIFVTIVHVLVTVFFVMVHFAALGACLARYIIISRIAITFAVCLTHDIVLLVGRDQSFMFH